MFARMTLLNPLSGVVESGCSSPGPSAITRRALAWGSVGYLLIALVGCGTRTPRIPRVSVEGEVLLDGKPLDDALIAFYPVGMESGPAAVAVVREGRFEIPQKKGPGIGKLRVEISTVPPEEGEPAEAGGLAVPPPPDPIPKRYRGLESTLSVQTRSESENKYRFELVTEWDNVTTLNSSPN